MRHSSILIVDDQPDGYDVIERYLDAHKYTLHYASSGIEALETLEIVDVDLVLLDLMMPEMDGMEVCRRIKASPQWRPIPVIMVTALTSKDDLAKALFVGADDFLSKPVNSLELRARVLAMLRIKHQHDEILSSHERERLLQNERRLLLQQRNLELETQVNLRTASLRSMMEAAALSARQDPLTNLPNRRMMLERIQPAISRQSSPTQPSFALLFLDLDRFSVINDSLGHLIGDQILITIGERLSRHVDSGLFVSRFGGDEFVVLVEESDGVEHVLQVAEDLIDSIRRPIGIDTHQVTVNSSVGIVFADGSYTEPNELLRDADLAMYKAKDDGGNCCRVFEKPMLAEVVSKQELEGELRKALVGHELIPFYQPIVDLCDQRCVAFEALCRWNHPVRGFISPGDFIPVAEETGLVTDLTRQMLMQTCQQLAAWRVAYPNQSSLVVSINLSAHDLRSPSLVAEIHQLLAACGLSGESITLEITESGLIENYAAALLVLGEIRSLGARISIDDFGTGYSSLSYLQQLPASGLKIDRSFVENILQDERSLKVVRAIITLGKELGMKTVAEGIESKEQLDLLRQLGCDYGQGFFFSKPLPAEMAEDLFLRSPGLSR